MGSSRSTALPVISALAQLNRKSLKLQDKRPMLWELRDSGEIEHDADAVIFVHRPEMHNPNDSGMHGYAEAMIRKNRSGPGRHLDAIRRPHLQAAAVAWRAAIGEYRSDLVRLKVRELTCRFATDF